MKYFVIFVLAAIQLSMSLPTARIVQEDQLTMNEDEMAMLKEINLLRTHPTQYIDLVIEYLERPDKISFSNEAPEEEIKQAVSELIEKLENTKPMMALLPENCLYRSAIIQGENMVKKRKFSHFIPGAPAPWQRVNKECNNKFLGMSENLVGGMMSIRDSVIELLIDAGVSDRGHRKALLEPAWRYGACYFAGTVKDIDNCWVQEFAR